MSESAKDNPTLRSLSADPRVEAAREQLEARFELMRLADADTDERLQALRMDYRAAIDALILAVSQSLRPLPEWAQIEHAILAAKILDGDGFPSTALAVRVRILANVRAVFESLRPLDPPQTLSKEHEDNDLGGYESHGGRENLGPAARPELSHAEPSFEDELTSLLNRHSLENASDTPDYILARHLLFSLQAWNASISERERWYGRETGSRLPRLGSASQVAGEASGSAGRSAAPKTDR